MKQSNSLHYKPKLFSINHICTTIISLKSVMLQMFSLIECSKAKATKVYNRNNPVNTYLFKINDKNTRKRCENV